MKGFMERPAGAAEKSPENTEVLDAAYEKAQALFNQEGVSMKDFTSTYGEAAVKEDERRVEEYEKIFEAKATPETKQQKKLATVLEALFYDQVHRNGWFGENARVLGASKFDDYVNGVDCITEYKATEGKGDNAYLAMAIDATSSSHPGSKFNRIREDLSRGKLGKLKYFKTENSKGLKDGVPKVVIGASPEALKEVIGLWLADDTETLKDHPIQKLFLEEIVAQLEGFKTFAENRHQEKNVRVFENYLTILKPILEEKRQTIPSDEKLEKDIILKRIKEQLIGFSYKQPTP